MIQKYHQIHFYLILLILQYHQQAGLNSLYSMNKLFDNLEFHGIVDDPSMTHNRNTKALVKKIRIFRDEILNDPEYTCEYHKNIGDGVLLLKVN